MTRPRRKPPRALKFAEVQVGDQVMQASSLDWPGMPPEWQRKNVRYYLITDMWSDPVAGQYDPVKGQMIGLARIREDGSLEPKTSTTIRGLASQQYDYADVDYLALCAARAEGMQSGAVIGIGAAWAIRERPKLPRGGL